MTMASGTITIMQRNAGKSFSIRGASHRPATKPRTTVGMEAIISTVGFTTRW